MTLADFYSELAERFNDPQNALFSQLRLRELINKAFRKIWSSLNANKIYLKKQTVTVSFVSGSQEIELPLVDITDDTNIRSAYKIISILDEDENQLEIYEEEFSKRSETPSCYFKSIVSSTLSPAGGGYLRKYYLGWYREPTSSFDITLLYNSQIQTYIDGDPLNKTLEDIPTQFHDVIVDCATYLGWSTRGIRAEVVDTIQFWKNEYNEGLANMVASIQNQADTQQSVVDVYAAD